MWKVQLYCAFGAPPDTPAHPPTPRVVSAYMLDKDPAWEKWKGGGHVMAGTGSPFFTCSLAGLIVLIAH